MPSFLQIKGNLLKNNKFKYTFKNYFYQKIIYIFFANNKLSLPVQIDNSCTHLLSY